MYDLLIRGGTVVDPSQGLHAVRDVGLRNGKVAAVEASISAGEAGEVVDASGLIVAPGLLDLHVHVFWGVSHFGIDPDMTSLAKGATTIVDAGSAGAATFPAFRRYVIGPSDTRIYSLLNISAMGMIDMAVGELEDLRWAMVDPRRRDGPREPGIRRGNQGAAVAGDGRANRTWRLSPGPSRPPRALDGFVMVHVGNTKTPLDELTEMLRPGDVVTHAYHGRPEGPDRRRGQGQAGHHRGPTARDRIRRRPRRRKLRLRYGREGARRRLPAGTTSAATCTSTTSRARCTTRSPCCPSFCTSGSPSTR